MKQSLHANPVYNCSTRYSLYINNNTNTNLITGDQIYNLLKS